MGVKPRSSDYLKFVRSILDFSTINAKKITNAFSELNLEIENTNDLWLIYFEYLYIVLHITERFVVHQSTTDKLEESEAIKISTDLTKYTLSSAVAIMLGSNEAEGTQQVREVMSNKFLSRNQEYYDLEETLLLSASHVIARYTNTPEESKEFSDCLNICREILKKTIIDVETMMEEAFSKGLVFQED